MKIVVDHESSIPIRDDGEPSQHYILDKKLYGYFLDLFDQEIKAYIESVEPGKILPTESVGGAQKVDNFFNNYRTIVSYYQKFNKHRGCYHLYKGHIYSYEVNVFIMFEIDLEIIRYDLDDLVGLLNKKPPTILERVKKYFLKKINRD